MIFRPVCLLGRKEFSMTEIAKRILGRKSKERVKNQNE